MGGISKSPWEAVSAPGGRTYWANRETGETTWDDPTAGGGGKKPRKHKPRKPPPPPEESSDEDSDSDSSDTDDDEECFPGEVEWDDLKKKQKKAAKRLGYKERAWNKGRASEKYEGVEWDDIRKKTKKVATINHTVYTPAV